ncbi:hypothetical protein PVA8_138 [Vibrio phage PVA8]|nr:hypothetical protein [Vibrio phage PC-Liy1]URQ03124.1 hypothetical protein PVA8_138 [Vibrio phage PVA8]WBM58859.1 hypothetical protein vBValMPVA8_137 [Vibrio phage vB_ValM_PVA8]
MDRILFNVLIAQLEEQRPSKSWVVGSNPSGDARLSSIMRRMILASAYHEHGLRDNIQQQIKILLKMVMILTWAVLRCSLKGKILSA